MPEHIGQPTNRWQNDRSYDLNKMIENHLIPDLDGKCSILFATNFHFQCRHRFRAGTFVADLRRSLAKQCSINIQIRGGSRRNAISKTVQISVCV